MGMTGAPGLVPRLPEGLAWLPEIPVISRVLPPSLPSCCCNEIPPWEANENQTLISHRSGDCESEIRVTAWPGSSSKGQTSCCVLTWWKGREGVL